MFGWVIQGASEEILVRGWFMTSVGIRYNAISAITLSSLLFALIHIGNDNLTILSIVNLLIFSVFASIYCLLDKSIWGICGFHTAWNWAQGNIVGFEVSGTTPAGGMLLDFENIGSDWLTGGSFGLEGGVTVTAIFALSIVGMLVYMFKFKSRFIE
ncbi:CPBP family intramembrane metalloprotease [Clostridiaceae bacterium M8S5]|nr:CPBP family intramembrane metalloprotease [Clostridiaceae bacterium M8S5]